MTASLERLYVEEIHKPQFLQDCIPVLDNWIQNAIDKISIVQARALQSFGTHWASLVRNEITRNGPNKELASHLMHDYLLLRDSEKICQAIAKDISRILDNRSTKNVWICRDIHGNTQAVAVIKILETRNILSYISTNPDNLKLKSFKTSSKGVKGAGTEIILKLALKTLETRKPYRILSTPSAIPFYKKLHIKFVSGEKNCLLEQTEGEILSLIANKTPPYNRLADSYIYKYVRLTAKL
jgi:hypothetical protein